MAARRRPEQPHPVSCRCRLRLPVGAASQVTAGPNRIAGEPRRSSAL